MHLGVSAVDLTMKSKSSISHIHISLIAYISVALNMQLSGFGGLGVACCLSVPKFAGSNLAEAVIIFQGEKILSTPSFVGEVKPSVPCRRFAACKRFLIEMWKSTFRQNYRPTFSPTVTSFAARISHVVCTWRHLAAEVGTSKNHGETRVAQ
jgi:hypothetical protein